jgi:peptide deformylase
VGVLRRVCIVMNEKEEMIELVNPEIIESDGEVTAPEGCLSLPGKFGMVTRPEHVRVRAQNRNGDWFETEGRGMTARCFCHEFEHLDGHLFDEHCDRFLSEKELDDFYRKADEKDREKSEVDKE